MYTSLITSAEKTVLQEDGSMFLDVAFNILDDEDEIVDSKRLAFPLESSSEEITSEVAKYTANFEAEKNHTLLKAEENALFAHVDETIKDIVGVEITQKDIVVNEN